MQKSIYIEVNEEITSIIDKLRQEPAEQIVLVIPQKAIITQGVINLKILKQQAEQMGKRISISTTDPQARKVIERVGLELSSANPNPEQASPDSQDENIAQQASNETIQRINQDRQTPVQSNSLQQNRIGSDTFYSVPTGPQTPPPTPQPANNFQTNQLSRAPRYQQNPTSPASGEKVFPSNPSNKRSKEAPRGGLLKSKRFLLIIIVLALIIGGGFWVLHNYPKIKVAVSPNKKEITKEIKVSVKTDGQVDSDKGEITGKVIETSVKKTMEFDTTGESYQGENGRAKGTITIANNYSSSDQPLVTRTRFLSKEGKLFRLIKPTTVPGMKGDVPGKIEVQVAADKTGEDFNIGPSSFTIEGFKNNPQKYEKFEVTSSASMTGGGKADDDKKTKAVSENDIGNAREKTINELEDNLENSLREKLKDHEKIMLDSTEKSIENATSSHQVGDAAEKFSYTIEEKVKTIAFQEQALQEIALRELAKEVNENFKIAPEKMELNYKRSLADFNDNTLTVNLEATVIAWAQLDEEKIRNGLVDKNEKEIRSFLSNYPGLNRAEIFLTPPQLNKLSTPRKENITIEKKME